MVLKQGWANGGSQSLDRDPGLLSPPSSSRQEGRQAGREAGRQALQPRRHLPPLRGVIHTQSYANIKFTIVLTTHQGRFYGQGVLRRARPIAKSQAHRMYLAITRRHGDLVCMGLYEARDSLTHYCSMSTGILSTNIAPSGRPGFKQSKDLIGLAARGTQIRYV